jgi:hypothetical protein
MQWYSAKEAARLRNVATATIIGHIDDGELEAVNVARRDSKRRRFRISEAMLAAFDEKRVSRPTTAPEAKSSRRTIQRPTKDYFAKTGGAK